MNKRILLLDAGNTRLKWAVIEAACVTTRSKEAGLSDSAAWLGQGAAAYHELELVAAHWQQWESVSACYGVHVGSEAAVSRVQQLLSSIKADVHWMCASDHAGGVHNAYQPPHSLGADRWAALLAVRQRTAGNALVVSAGTALTIDALDANGHFLGGMILPGLHRMRYALEQDTAKIGMQYGKFQDFPITTANAVESGLIGACIGAIATMQTKLEKKCGSPPRIFLTGGDGASLRFFLPDGVTMVPALVLEGVYYLSLEEQAL